MKTGVQLFIFYFIFNSNLCAQMNESHLWKSGGITQIDILECLPEIWNNDLIFYGFIHGAAMPQEVDAKILKGLMAKGLKYYAPEVSYSGAYFINKYFETGDVTFLEYVLRSYNAPQDASIQWIKKYEEIYRFAIESGNMLQVIGIDKEKNDNLITTHLANLLDGRRTGIEVIDSLSQYKNLVDEVLVWSGKPLSELYKEHGYSKDEVLYENNAQPNYTRRFFEFCRSNMKVVIDAFGKDSLQVEHLLESHLIRKEKREQFITKNFEELILPKMRTGEKVYSNFGYAHILQDKLNGRMYLAGRLKEKYPDFKIYSILTQMADSEVLDRKKWCKNESIERFGKKIRLASICGTETSTELDGDTKKESVKGIDDLKKHTKMEEMTIIPINKVDQNLQSELYYLGYVEGKNPDELRFESSKTTSDYFQALIFIRGSGANETYEMYGRE